ncbi:hypothetical protein, partial [Nitrobacter winogradskyi]|uniref:hypothetical protein n=1 Tax=Nitrobacter winogradskyi TaxID=913 RepID=UPI001AEE70E9
GASTTSFPARVAQQQAWIDPEARPRPHQMKATPPRTTHQTPPRETSTPAVAMPQPQPTRQWPTE